MQVTERHGRRFATIIGAGPGGIAAAMALKAAGIDDFLIVERAATVGGTWTNNRYPGLCCDVPSLVYGFNVEQKVDWSRAFAPQPEIRRYIQEVADKYDVTDHIRFQTTVVAAEWSDETGAWTLTAEDGWTTSSTVVISALGMFNRLHWPEIPGLQDFAGTTVHAGAWPEQKPDLAGKAVAVIGTAASAVQMVPELAKEVGALDVYQRTPNWIFPKEDPEYTAEELEGFRNDPASLNGPRADVVDYFERLVTYDEPEMIEELRASAMENLAVIQDAELRRKMVPSVPIGAQRPLFSNTFYPTFNEDHVELVTEAISHITPHGIVSVDGRERKYDAIIAATGYKTDRFLSVIDVKGRGGRALTEVWAEGAYAYKGMTIPEFPNLFMLYGPNTNNGSIIRMLELQADYVVAKLQRMRDEGLDSIEVSDDATVEYNAWLQRKLDSVGPWREVGSRYYRSDSGRIVTQWPGNMADFEKLLSDPDDGAFTVSAAQVTEPEKTSV
ncbi:flavin-containing monooxygenase [Gordonia terrae]|uniref:flavin-containing monooxygenase n=1 Tax=Gordonia terrae TaxID=2055 RepID=UPI003F6BFE53